MNRRDFCQRTAKTFGFSALLAKAETGLHADSRSPQWKTAIGLNGFASGERKYQRQYPLWEILEFAHQTGFDGVELVEGWPSGGYPRLQKKDRARALKGLYDRYGLQVFSLQVGAGGAFDPDAQKRRQWLQSFKEKARLASYLGCDCLGMWPGGGLRGQGIEQAIRHLSASFSEAARVGEQYGLVVAFEIEPPFVFNTESHLSQILEQTEGSPLKTIYDPSHFDLMSGSRGRPHEMLDRIGVETIGYVHLTDCDGTLRDGGTSKHLGCGDGHVDIPASLNALGRGGFEGWIMIDQWEVPDPYDASEKGLRAIQKGKASLRL